MGGSPSQFIHLCAYFNHSLCLCLSVSLFVSESFFPFLSRHLTVAVGLLLLLWRCAAGQRGWVHSFQWSSHRGPHLGAADWICSLKRSEAWSVHCEQRHSGPRPFNRRPQRFLFTSIVLSFSGSLTWPSGSVVLLFVFMCFNAKWGRVRKRLRIPQSELSLAFDCKSLRQNYII